jgi:hypothetical protein
LAAILTFAAALACLARLGLFLYDKANEVPERKDFFSGEI